MVLSEITKSARESLKNYWGLAIGACVIYIFIQVVVGIVPIAGTLAGLIISGPLMLGLTYFSLSISRGQEPKLDQLFQGFNNFSNSMATYLLMILFVLLWALLLIVPGIIMAIAYSMTFFILADEPNIKPMEALEKSKKMMDGYKMKMFMLYMRFLLLSLACILTLGIGFFFLLPYIQICTAKFYEYVKVKHVESAVL